MRMGVMLLKIRISLFFFSFLLLLLLLLLLLFPASLFTSCHAGRHLKSMDKLAKEVDMSEKSDQEEAWKETTSSSSSTTEEELAETIIHERLLKVNAKDYGRHDPAPALVRPPFKLIPN
ncbi:protein CASPARIAN STRIP INTEGRITY FACTOR 2-like [Rhodamnia argentea]|uniref:Protein CASPARIAN STRIP INTEGRITY FACTOR 2-like n=1 Tax=Rhodamnia argentea TaxID=178133 RepID=A0A8B8MS11_9MYRT|nr:protein CASPARIAN STRIP INTEGRITY FACTOR 2-like [Rhodamnia argentea]